MNRLMITLTVALLGACASPRYLTYDFGRAFSSNVTAQADLTPSVAAGAHPLGGREAEAIRIAVQTETSDQESGTATVAQ